MNFLNIFFGSKQSKFAALAIFTAIIAICLSILFTTTDISIGKRFSIIFFIILACIPSVLFTLFELTCIVTGGNKKNNWWCYYFAWIISAILIIYSIIVIISTFISLFSYNTAMSRINDTENSKKISKDEANNYAKNIIESYNNSENNNSENNNSNMSSNIQPHIQKPKEELPTKKESFETRYTTSQPMLVNDVNSLASYDGLNNDMDKFALF